MDTNVSEHYSLNISQIKYQSITLCKFADNGECCIFEKCIRYGTCLAEEKIQQEKYRKSISNKVKN